MLTALSKVVNVTAFERGIVDQYLVTNSTPIETRVNAAPVKVRKRLAGMLRQGMDVAMQGSLGRGVNPFTESADVCLHEMGRMLVEGGFTRADLVRFLMGVHQWQKNSAQAHVSQCIALLRGLELIEEAEKLVRTSSQIQRVQI